jgi:preprotein translocase subunit YajC
MKETWLPEACGILLGQQQGPGILASMMPVLIIMLLFYFILLRPQQRDRMARQAMLDTLKKNDRVLTAGGVVGVVTNIRKEAGEVTIRTHEDTKLDIARSFITRVLTDAPVSGEEPG